MAVPRLEDGEQRVFFKAGGEWCYLWTPEAFRIDEPVPVVIHHHGNRGYVRDGTADWLEEDYKIALLRAVMRSGCAVAGSHACGNHWGNPCSVESNAALFDALVECPCVDPGRLGLMGGGLGGALIWNAVAGPLSGGVKAVAVMQAVASLEAIVREKKFKDQCLGAYGLPADTPDDEAVNQIRPSDPLPKLRKLAPGAPLPVTAIYHGAEDNNIPPGSNAIPLAEALRKAGGEVKLELIPEVGHAVYAMGKPIEERLEAFFAANL